MNFLSLFYKNHKPLNGILFFIVLTVLIYFNPYEIFRYDCRLYWELTKQYNAGGNFSLLNFNEALRGYLFSLFLYPSYFLSSLFNLNEVITCRLYLSFILSLFYAYGAGFCYKTFFKEILHPISHAFLGVILLLLWWEYFTLPLTDVLGFILLLGAFLLISKKGLIPFFTSGLLLYASLNIRLIYILAIPFYIYLVYITIRSESSKLKLIALSLFGFMLAALPQISINILNFKTTTLLVPTQASKETGGKNLYFMQLNWGLSVQKYETNLGEKYPVPEIKYLDTKGLELSAIHGNKDFESYFEYLSFSISHPTIVFIWLKHAFNGFDITTPRAYLKSDIGHRNIFLKIFNFSLLFLGLFSVIHFFKKMYISLKVFSVLVIGVVGIVIPTALEVRFFLPAHILLYLFGIYLLQSLFRSSLILRKKSWGLILVCYLCFVSIGLYRSSKVMDQVQYKTQVN